MLGKRKAQRDLFDVGNVFPVALDPQSFHGQLATAADRLFRDEDFAAFYAERLGRFSTPPSLLALMTLMHHQGDCSDQEAVERTAMTCAGRRCCGGRRACRSVSRAPSSSSAPT